MSTSPTRLKRQLIAKAQRLREEAAAIERQAEAIQVEPAKPHKTKAQLEQELAEEREQRQRAESEARHLRRRLDPPDMSYFGLGDGPT